MVSSNACFVQAATNSLCVDMVGTWLCKNVAFLHSQLHHQVKYRLLCRPLCHGKLNPGMARTSISLLLSEMYAMSR